jgi:uncharacterized protein YndB with AHSA1/START domain
VSSKHRQDADGYVRQVRCRAPRERVFDAIATLRGVRSWWTPVVTGSPSPGDALTFGFAGLDEAIVMRIEETTFPARVRWTCLKHTSAPAWTETGVSFELSERGPDECVLTFQHIGIDAADVAAGWDRFLTSLARLVETGAGEPYRAVTDEALDVARAYHAAWTGKDFAAARRYLAEDLQTDVPLNTYIGPDDFAAAVARFGALTDRVDLLAEFGSAAQALLLYDMHTQPFGTLRVAEHFTVDDGLIRSIRHVHDTAALRQAG